MIFVTWVLLLRTIRSELERTCSAESKTLTLLEPQYAIFPPLFNTRNRCTQEAIDKEIIHPIKDLWGLSCTPQVRFSTSRLGLK